MVYFYFQLLKKGDLRYAPSPFTLTNNSKYKYEFYIKFIFW